MKPTAIAIAEMQFDACSYLTSESKCVKVSNMAHQQTVIGGQMMRNGANRCTSRGVAAPVARLGGVGPSGRQPNLPTFDGLRSAVLKTKVLMPSMFCAIVSRGISACGVLLLGVLGLAGVAACESTKRISGSKALLSEPLWPPIGLEYYCLIVLSVICC